jgi:hypothetical protein
MDKPSLFSSAFRRLFHRMIPEGSRLNRSTAPHFRGAT